MATRRLLFLGVVFGVGLISTAVAAPAPVDARILPELAKARLDAARKAYELSWGKYEKGVTVDVEKLYIWSCRWLDSQRAMSDKKADEVAAVEAHLNRMKKLEELVKKKYDADSAAAADYAATQFYRTEAEIWLSQAKPK